GDRGHEPITPEELRGTTEQGSRGVFRHPGTSRSSLAFPLRTTRGQEMAESPDRALNQSHKRGDKNSAKDLVTPRLSPTRDSCSFDSMLFSYYAINRIRNPLEWQNLNVRLNVTDW